MLLFFFLNQLCGGIGLTNIYSHVTKPIIEILNTSITAEYSLHSPL